MYVIIISDIFLSNLDVSLSSHSKLLKDTSVTMEFNVSMGLTGYPFQAYNTPPIGFEIFLSDQNDITPSGGFNGGSLVSVVTQESVSLNPTSYSGNSKVNSNPVFYLLLIYLI